jgi:L-serine deaminase
MRMITIPNQSSVAMAYKEFDEAGRMKPSAYYDRVVDVIRAAGLRGSSSRTAAASSVPVPRRNADPAGDVSESSRGKRLAALAEPVGSA